MKNLLVYTCNALRIKILYPMKSVFVFTLKCSECICDIEDCKVSQSPFECPNCILDKCCCWENFHFNEQ